MVKEKSPNSPVLKNAVLAFVVGGLICVVGQFIKEILLDKFTMTMEAASAWTSVILIFLGVLFTAIGWYNKLAKHAGAGTLVPITGFANAVSSPAIEFKTEGIITGMCSKMFIIAGPIIVVATVGSVVYGIVLLFIK